MIHEEICTYEVCKLAKAKGFNVPTFGYYRIDTEDWYRTDVYDDWNDSTIRYSAPTQSLLQRWLREEKNIHIEIYPVFPSPDKVKYGRWVVADAITKSIPIEYFDTYEQALEDALAYGLRNLD